VPHGGGLPLRSKRICDSLPSTTTRIRLIAFLTMRGSCSRLQVAPGRSEPQRRARALAGAVASIYIRRMRRQLAIAAIAAIIASAATLIVSRPTSADAQPAMPTGCNPPYGAHWLCPGNGIYMKQVGWSCFNYGTHVYCSLGGSASTATRASVSLLPNSVGLQIGHGRYETFRAPG
jgi:hypothetical protein